MHDKRKNNGLNDARIVGSLGIITIILHKIALRINKSGGSRTIAIKPDHLGASRMDVDLMRRRLNI